MTSFSDFPTWNPNQKNTKSATRHTHKNAKNNGQTLRLRRPVHHPPVCPPTTPTPTTHTPTHAPTCHCSERLPHRLHPAPPNLPPVPPPPQHHPCAPPPPQHPPHHHCRFPPYATERHWCSLTCVWVRRVSCGTCSVSCQVRSVSCLDSCRMCSFLCWAILAGLVV